MYVMYANKVLSRNVCVFCTWEFSELLFLVIFHNKQLRGAVVLQVKVAQGVAGFLLQCQIVSIFGFRGMWLQPLSSVFVAEEEL